jgi:hypothetical protein
LGAHKGVVKLIVKELEKELGVSFVMILKVQQAVHGQVLKNVCFGW